MKSGLNEDPESSVGISISSTKTIDTQGPDIENTEKSSEEKPVEKSKIQLYINHYLTFSSIKMFKLSSSIKLV